MLKLKFHEPASVKRPKNPELEKQVQRAYDQLLSRTDLGWINLIKAVTNEDDSISEPTKSIKTRLAQISAMRLIVVGIGGSSLGAKSFLATLPRSSKEVLFLENVDPFTFEQNLSSIQSEQSHFLIVSKSGKTMETLSITQLILQVLKKQNPDRKDFKNRFTVVCEKQPNPLRDWAEKLGIPAIEIPQDVGGRFSVLSAVGEFPARFAGVDYLRVKLGARLALNSEHRQIVEKLALEVASSFTSGNWVTVLWSYADRLEEFGYWWQQLWAESLAKTNNQNGQPAPRVSTPLPCVGSVAQHSVLQQFAQGAPDKFFVFQKVESYNKSGSVLEHIDFQSLEFMEDRSLGDLLNAELAATIQSLTESQRASLELIVPDLSLETMGCLFMTWQLVVGVLGELLCINAYDQPGVERAKVLAREQLKKI